MKTTCSTIICLTALTLTSALAQQSATTAPLSVTISGGGGITDATPLAKFNLDFPGGTPKELVAAIEKATGRPLNCIIMPVDNESADTKIPALKMNSVDVPQLFEALNNECQRGDVIIANKAYELHYGFKTEGKPSADSIWYFYVYRPVLPPARRASTR